MAEYIESAGNAWGEFFEPCFCDLNGNPVERTPRSHPYAYDEYVLFKSKDFNEKDNWVYSDRLKQWDAEKFDKAVKEASDGRSLGLFGNWKPEEIESFLKSYFGKPVKLTAVVQGCNVSTGYPYWLFTYKDLSEI